MANLNYSIPPLGGLKQNLPPQLVQRHMAVELSGLWPKNGQIRRIPGKQKHSATQLAGGAVMAFATLALESGTKKLVAISQDKAYTYNTSTQAYDAIQDGTDFTGTLDTPFVTAQFLDSSAADILIISNYNDAVRKWTGAGNIATLGGTPPKAKLLCVYENYLVMGHIDDGTARPRRLAWSALGNGESWPAGNVKDFKKSADWLSALATMRDTLVVYKEKSISLMEFVAGALVFDVTENFVNNVGPLNQAALVPYGEDSEEHYFLGTDLHVYRFNGIDYKKISPNIGTIIGNLHPSYKTRACGHPIREEEKIIWSVPYGDDETNKTLLILNVRDESWWIKDAEPVAVQSIGETVLEQDYTWNTLPWDEWDEWDDPNGWDSRNPLGNAPVILLGGADGYVRRFLDGVNDDGANLPSRYRYPWDNLDGKDDTLKQVSKIIVEVENSGSGSILFEAFCNQNAANPVNLDEDGNKSASVPLYGDDQNAAYVYHEIETAILGYNFQWKLSSANTSWAGRILRVEYEIVGEGLD